MYFKAKLFKIVMIYFLVVGANSAFAGNTPTSVPGKSGNPRCLTSSNANPVAKSAVTKSSMKLCQAGDGLSQETAGSSAWQIKRDFPDSVDGNYWIKNSNVNGGAPFQIYADMTTNGGGWTLIVANSTFGWNYSEALLNNQNTPPVNPTNLSSQGGKYSILSYADSIKKSRSGFQYRIDAENLGTCGGIWTANSPYSFTSTSNLNSDVTLNTKWGNWFYNDHGIEKRMPWLDFNSGYNQGLLTTSEIPGGGAWWGTIIQSSNWEGGSAVYTTPWISYLGWGDEIPENGLEPCSRPSIIWYWVR